MPRHRWSLFCRRAVIDKNTNLLSIIEVLDEASARSLDRPESDNVAIQIEGDLISLWERSDPSVPETFLQGVSITTPDGETHDVEIRVEGNLEGSFKRTRVVTRVQALPYRGPGVYAFNILLLGEDPDEAEIVATVPIELKEVPAD